MRQRILNEIRRLAKDNGGKAPGQELFKRLTGISRAAWLGVYWARWGDALTEAGFEPKQLQGRESLNRIFEGLAQAIRHYGKMPSEAELRMYRRSNPLLPSHSTLTNRFANKNERLAKLREWLEAHPEYSDIEANLPDQTPDIVTVQSDARVGEGYVYLIGSGNHYKIGRSDELERRVKKIRVALPEATTLIHTIRTDDPAGIEAYWHRRFADRRANGEWFRLTLKDVAAFKRRKFQ
jgi:hypothetical protein